jgi:hypothetical protein
MTANFLFAVAKVTEFDGGSKTESLNQVFGLPQNPFPNHSIFPRIALYFQRPFYRCEGGG